MSKRIRSIGLSASLLALALLAGGLLVASCSSEDGSLPTGSSAFVEKSQPGGPLGQVGASAHGGDDRSSDDDSSDDSSDDDSSDDNTGNDNNAGSGSNRGPGRRDEEDVRGLLFALGACAGDECEFTIKSTTVRIIRGRTRLDNEATGEERVPFDTFIALLQGNAGLPMRAEGPRESGVVVATRARIDDELKASGRVIAAAGGLFTLRVNDNPLAPVILFRVLPGVAPPQVGASVRIEANVPRDLTPPVIYEAFQVQRN